MTKSLISLFCSCTLLLSCVTAHLADVKQVKTSSGVIKGHASKVQGTQDVSEYLGIQFGEATNGSNRFMKPKPYLSDGPIEASNFVSLVVSSISLLCADHFDRDRKKSFSD